MVWYCVKAGTLSEQCFRELKTFVDIKSAIHCFDEFCDIFDNVHLIKCVSDD